MITHSFIYKDNKYYFNNKTFEIYNTNYEPIIRSQERHITENYNTLKVIVNSICNFHCNYCLQKHSLQEINNKDIDYFINFLNQEYSTKTLNKIEFWGGEPFLSFDKIIKIIEKINKPSITYSFVTNGSLLTKEIVSKINNIENKFIITISHDSYAQKETRNVEVLDEIKECIQLLQSNPKNTVTINNVISKYNTDLNKSLLFYENYISSNNLKPFLISFEVCQAYDELSKQYVFDNNYENYNLFYTFYETQTRNKNRLVTSLIHDCYSPSVTSVVKLFKQPLNFTNQSKCYIDSNNTVTYNAITHKKVLCTTFNEKEKEIFTIEYYENCKKCPCLRLCRSGCLANEKKYFNINCQPYKCLYTSMIEFVLSGIFNEKITLQTISIE